MRRRPTVSTPHPPPLQISLAQVCVAGVSFIHLFTIKQIHRPVKVRPVDFPLQSEGDQCKEAEGGFTHTRGAI